MKKRIVISLFVALVAALAGVGIYRYMHRDSSAVGAVATSTISQTQQDRIFRDYLVKTAQTKTIGSTFQYSGTGMTLSGRASYDLPGKRVLSNSELTCNAEISGAPIAIKATLQSENAERYVRLNEISGTLPGDNGLLYLSDIFAKAVGSWYKLPEPDTAVSSQLDAGFLAFEDGLFAPGYDAQKVTQAFIIAKAFEYSGSKDGNDYTFHVTPNAQNYMSGVAAAFPNVPYIDGLQSYVFDATGNSGDTLQLRADGSLISDSGSMQNPCDTLVQTLVGVSADNIPKVVLGTTKPTGFSDITITPIASSRPIIELTKDLKM